MENWTESLEKYLEEGKLPLIGEKFSRKKEIGDKLKLQREESHKIALSRTVLTKDLNATLEKVFGSCGISYELRGKEIILK